MNPLAFRLVRGDIAQEGHELCRGVSWRRFAQHLTRLGIESGVQRQSAMAASQSRRRPESTYGYSGVCQITIAGQKGEPYRRFLSWVFIDLETGQYDENKYVVAINYPNQTVDLYAHYHVALCSNSEDGLSLESGIGISKYQ